MDTTELAESYGTLTETINALVALGYKLDFNVHEESDISRTEDIQLSPEFFKIDKFYRFEGMSDPEDQSILYAISSEKFKVKGILLNGYGTGANAYATALVASLESHDKLA